MSRPTPANTVLGVLAAAFCLACAAPRCLGERLDRVHYGGVYLYRFTLDRNNPEVDEERWQRILNTPEATYVCSQVSAPAPGERVIRRVREAAAAGKRVVLQLWWGGAGRYNWSKYSLAHIGMDPEIRQEFFAEVVDPLFAAVGSGNVYAAHLLEETGMQFGVDLDVPGAPHDLTDGDDNGSNWDQPTWLGRGAVAGYIGGPYVPNIRRYNEQFKRDTGFDMEEAAIWSRTGGWGAYREWVSAKLEAGAMNAFADHLHRNHPSIKAFTWDALDWGGCGANNMRAMKGKVDGLIMDPYSKAAGIYAAVRGPRLIDPDLEIIAVLWGVDDKPEGEMLNRAAAAYAGGADVIAFFGDKSFESEGTWRERVRQFAPFTRLPPFETRPPVLLITMHASWAKRLCGFAWFDAVSRLEAGPVDLSRYALVVLYAGGDHPGLREYVRNGGRVLATGPLPFLLDQGLIAERGLATHPRKEEIDYRPNAWWREQFGLDELYPLQVSRRLTYEPAAEGVRKDHALLIPYGKGEICLLQSRCGWNYAPPDRLRGRQRLLADLARGLLARAGKTELAEAALSDERTGLGWLKVRNTAGNLTTHCVAVTEEAKSLPLSGKNLIGPDSPIVGKDVRGAVIKR